MQKQNPEYYPSRLAAQCGYWSPGKDQFLAGEIVSQWSHRESFRRDMCRQQVEVLKRDALLGGLFYEMKKKLCRQGRNGGWSAWLKQQKIARSTADRLVLDHVEFHGLKDEFSHRQSEPLEGNICVAANRTADRLNKMLRNPKSRMSFVQCLADLFGLTVEFEGESVRLSIPQAVDFDDPTQLVPNVIEIGNDGEIIPINYELPDGSRRRSLTLDETNSGGR